MNREWTARWRNEYLSEPQPEQTPQVISETSSNGTLAAPSEAARPLIISPPFLIPVVELTIFGGEKKLFKNPKDLLLVTTDTHFLSHKVQKIQR